MRSTGHLLLSMQMIIMEDMRLKQFIIICLTHEDDDKYRYAMVGYLLKNTVTDNGHVARGICTT